MTSVGAYLRELRDRRGVPLAEISRITRVASRYLEALEADAFASLPPPVFVRGFVRAYCQALGESPDDALALYDAREGRPPQPIARPVAPAGRPGGAEPRSRGAVLVSLVLLVVLGMALFTVALVIQPGDRGTGDGRPAVTAPVSTPAREPEQPTGTPAPAVTAPAPAVTPVAPPAPAPAVTPPPARPPAAAPQASQPAPATPARPRTVSAPSEAPASSPSSSPVAGAATAAAAPARPTTPPPGPTQSPVTTAAAPPALPGRDVPPPAAGLAPTPAASTSGAGTSPLQATAPASSVSPAVQAAAAGAASPYRLVARTSDATWIRVRTEDGSSSEENVPAGQVREWVSNRPFVVTVGNAGGVTLELNGRALPPLGERGVVIPRLVLPPESR